MNNLRIEGVFIQTLLNEIKRLDKNKKKELWNCLKQKYREPIKELKITLEKNKDTAFQILLFKLKRQVHLEFIGTILSEIKQSAQNELKSKKILPKFDRKEYIEHNNLQIKKIFQSVIEKSSKDLEELEEINKLTIRYILNFNNYPTNFIEVVIDKLFNDRSGKISNKSILKINPIYQKKLDEFLYSEISLLCRKIENLMNLQSFRYLSIAYYIFSILQAPLNDLMKSDKEFYIDFFDEESFHRVFLESVQLMLKKLDIHLSKIEDLELELEKFYFFDEEVGLQIDPFPWLS